MSAKCYTVSYYLLHGIPVEDVIVGEALSVEEIADELAQVGVVRLLLEAQRAAVVQVSGELRYKGISYTYSQIIFVIRG